MKHTSLESNLDEWINAALDGKLNEREQSEFDRYLAAHPEAREAYEETQAMNRLLEKTLKKDQPDPGFEDRMVSRFRRGKNSRDLGFWKNWASLWQGQKTVYAGALAALVISFYIGGAIDENKSNQSGEGNPRVVATNGTANPDASGLNSAEAQKEVDLYFNSPDPIHYTPPGAVTKSGNGNLTLSGINSYTGEATISAGDLKTDATGKKMESLKDVVGNKALQVPGNTSRGDFNLNAVKIALEKPLSDENVLQSGFRTDLMLGEDKVAMGNQIVPLWHTGVLSSYNGYAVKDQKFGLVNGATPPAQTNPAGNVNGRAAGQPVATAQIDKTVTKPEVSKRAEAQKIGASDPKEFHGKWDRAWNPEWKEAAPVETEIQRKLIRNANIGLEVRSYAAALRDLSHMAEEEKGFVATQNDRTQSNGHTAGQVIIKLPPGRLDEFVLRLRELGTVQRQVLKMDDVTKAYFDTEARLRNARKTEERLLELMAKKTDKVADLLQVEKEIGRVRESIEQMQGELKLWDSLASLATVTIDLVEQDMDQAAAYLLKETANLSLYSADVDKSYKEARDLAEKSEAQIITAQVNRTTNGQVNATLSLLAAPEKAFLLIEQLKGLGRVQSFTQDTQRVAQDGNAGITGTTRRDKVEIQVSIVHDDASRKTVTLQVVTSEVEKALDACKRAALGASGEVLASNLQRDTNGHSRAELTIRIPAKNLEQTKTLFNSQGRVVRLSVDRNDDTGTNIENEDASPVILALTLSDEEPPVQLTRLDVEGDKVAAKVEELKKRARDLGIEIRASSFVRQLNGVEQANLVFRMTQKEYVGMLESLLSTGKTLNMTLERSDRIDSEKNDEASEPVEVLFRLKSSSPLVENQNGFVGAVKNTLGKSFNVLGGSLQRIVTGFAYLLPWLLVGGVGVLVWRKVKRKK